MSRSTRKPYGKNPRGQRKAESLGHRAMRKAVKTFLNTCEDVESLPEKPIEFLDPWGTPRDCSAHRKGYYGNSEENEWIQRFYKSLFRK